MSSSAVAMGRVALAALIIGAAPAFAQQAQPNKPDVITAQTARIALLGSPEAAARNASLRPPPPGPIESRLVSVPDGSPRPPRDAAASSAPGAVEPSGQSASNGPVSGPIFAN